MDSNSVKALAENSEVVSSLIDIIPAIIYAGATIFAGVAAIYGIRSWRKEFRGKRQIELAENTLELFYNAKDAIGAIRYPIRYENEGSIRPVAESESESETEKRYRDQAYVVYKRLKEHQGTFNKLYAMRYRFMARIGKDKAKPFNQIRHIVNEILVAADTLAELWVDRADYPRGQKPEGLEKSIKEYEAIFCWQGSKDKINNVINKAVSDMEQTCNNIIAKGQ